MEEQGRGVVWGNIEPQQRVACSKHVENLIELFIGEPKVAQYG